MFDECCPGGTPAIILRREMPEATDIRVEVRVRQVETVFMQNGADVAEVCSPPRVAHDAGIQKYLGMDLAPGWSLDLSVVDKISGLPWDLSTHGMTPRATELVLRGRPHTVVCSPACTPFSALQNFTKAKRDSMVFAEGLGAGIEQIKCCIELGQIQRHGGSTFRH